MTLPPVERMHLVKGIEGPKYKAAARCSMPTCSKFSEHVHHIFRRSAIGGDYAWVLVDGKPVGNLTGLCVECHNEVTGRIGGHKAAIRLDTETWVFHWAWVETTVDQQLEYVIAGALLPQPPTPESLSERAAGQEATESEHCPTCGQARRRRLLNVHPPGERRRRKSWNVSVPDDSEDGAELLDAYVEDVEQLLGAGDWAERNKRYWALMHALAWVMQHREAFASDVSDAA